VPVDAASGDWRLRGPTRRKTRPAQEYARLVQLQNTGLGGANISQTKKGGIPGRSTCPAWMRLYSENALYPPADRAGPAHENP
jgi:hypothetical protein